MLTTLRTSFSRPESEVLVSYVASQGIPASLAERHHATCNGDYLVAQRGIRIQLPEACLEDAEQLLLDSSPSPELSESRAFTRHAVANTLVFVAALAGLGFLYFPYWMRAQSYPPVSAERPRRTTRRPMAE